MKRRIALLIVLTMLMAALFGCSSGSTGTTTAGTASEGAPQASANMNAEGLPIVKDKITLTVMQYIRDTDAITMDGLWYAEKIEEDTNIHIDYTQVNQSEWNNQVNLMFASGDYTDIIINGGTIDSELYGVDQGILIPLNDLIDAYMPVYKSRLDADPIPWASLIKSDGLMYAIGRSADYGSNMSTEFFINQTWLDNLGLETPTNTDELLEVLRKFISEDANGNGDPSDEIGYEGIFDELTTLFPVLWGIPENSTHIAINDDKKVEFLPFRDNYRDVVEFMSTMYSEGLMDPATMTQDANSKISMYNQNNVGLTTMHRLKSMGWDILEQDMVHLMPPAAEGCTPEFDTSFGVASESVYFTATNEYLPESARWVDYQMTDQITFESYYGPEGVLWDWNEDNKCELGPAGDQGVMEYALGVCGIYYMPGYYYNTVFQQPDYRLERIGYNDTYKAAGYLSTYGRTYASSLAKYTPDQTNERTQIFANIEAIYDEAIADMIMHGVTDDKWNTMIQRLTDAGVDRYLEIYQQGIDGLELNPLQ